MLNPPLSLLPDDLLASIVEQLAKLPFADENLMSLSLADRAFTKSCQKYIFSKLILMGNYRRNISKEIKLKKKILDKKPSFANRVRMVRLAISREENVSVIEDPNLTSIFQLLAKSPMPPHKLHFGGNAFSGVTIDDPILVVRRLMDSFFSQTLTILNLSDCKNVPLPLFLIFPRLRELVLDEVGATDKSYDKYPDNQCSGRAPLLEVVNYRDSHSLVQQMIAPPPRFNTPVVLWSKLRVLTIAPRDKEGVACLQTILDAACNTMEELYLTGIHVGESNEKAQTMPIAGLLNLSKLLNLRVFSLYTFINCKREAAQNATPFAVIHDINIVLGTIPDSNIFTNLWFEFTIFGRHPFPGCLDQDWGGMFNEVIRISGGKPLEMEFMMAISDGLEIHHSGEVELYNGIMDNAALLSDYPKICTHWWNPTYWLRELSPFPRGQVRERCRR